MRKLNTIFALFASLVISSTSFAVQIKTGTYTGNATDNRNITGIGFQPDFVLIRGLNSSSGAYRTSSMVGDASFQFDAGSLQADYIQQLSSDGFQLGTSSEVNANAVTFSYVALKADSTNFAVGTYTGDGTDPRTITVGFQPSGCTIRHDSSSFREPIWSSSSMSANTSFFYADATGSVSGAVESFVGTGFTVGSSSYSNANGENYYWSCWADTAGLIKTGSYAGTGVAHDVTGFGFQPKFMWLEGGTTRLYTYLPGVGVTDNVSYQLALNGSFSDIIQAIVSDGFTAGTNSSGNNNGTTFYYWALTDGTGSGGGGGGASTLPNSLL